MDINSKAQVLKDIIKQRRSIFPKSYSSQPISQEMLHDILEVATLAPNHKRTRPWRFKIFQGEEKNQLGRELQNIYKTITPEAVFLQKKYEDILYKVNKADAIISIVAEISPLVPEWEEIAAVAMGVQNMYLMSTAHGIGCYWSSPKLVNYLKESLSIEEDQRCLGLFYMGHVQPQD